MRHNFKSVTQSQKWDITSKERHNLKSETQSQIASKVKRGANNGSLLMDFNAFRNFVTIVKFLVFGPHFKLKKKTKQNKNLDSLTLLSR